MNKETVTLPKECFLELLYHAKERTALIDALFRENMYPRFDRVQWSSDSPVQVRCELYKFELKGEVSYE